MDYLAEKCINLPGAIQIDDIVKNMDEQTDSTENT
jgi:hypothetical protein